MKQPSRLKRPYYGLPVTPLFAAFCLIAAAHPGDRSQSPLSEETYFGVFLQGSKVGHQVFRSSATTYQGKAAVKSTSETIIKVGLIGSTVDLTIFSETISVNGSAVQLEFRQASAGRTQHVVAQFSGKSIELTSTTNGEVTRKTLKVPSDGEVVDDPIRELINSRSAFAGRPFYVLDPTTLSLTKNTVKLGEKKKEIVAGVETQLQAVEINDPRISSTVYVTGKGEIVRVSTGLGIELHLLTKDQALDPDYKLPDAPGGPAGNALPDLATATRISPSPALKSPDRLSMLSVYLEAKNLKTVPSDRIQVATRQGDGWNLTIVPKSLSASTISIPRARAQQPYWVKPSHLMPSNKPEFIKLARQLTKGATSLAAATEAIRRHVNPRMIPNASIGVLRDATEILGASEGVCRDYAILTATLCRAAGIPSRLASGLVNWDGDFYYHAWIEVWNGAEWIGVDSVSPSARFSASHIKLAQGQVEDAFNFTVLYQPLIQVKASKAF